MTKRTYYSLFLTAIALLCGVVWCEVLCSIPCCTAPCCAVLCCAPPSYHFSSVFFLILVPSFSLSLCLCVGAWVCVYGRSLGVFNTAGIINSLKKMSRQTFFGDLQFNPYRRNVAKIPATFQNLPDNSQSSGINQACVLPIAFGNAEIVYPDPLSIPNVPTSLSVFVIIAITVSAAFLVLLAIVIFLVYRHFNVDTKAIRIARSKNLPVHLSILKQASANDLLRYACHVSPSLTLSSLLVIFKSSSTSLKK